MVTCDTVTVTVSHDREGAWESVLPAYTVTTEALAVRLATLSALYVETSREQARPVSLADFTLYLLRVAAGDPTTQEG